MAEHTDRPKPVPEDTPEDRAIDYAAVLRHSDLIERYRDASVAEILQDLYFLSQLAMFKERQHSLLVAVHHQRENAACVCRTTGCGHRADQHPSGICNICQKLCWS